MFLIVSFLIAAALAIPTFGISLVVFFLVKRAIDKKAMSTIFSMAVTSMSTEVTQELYHINKAAVHKVFDNFCVNESEEVRNIKGMSIYWGEIMHPMINEGRIFSLRVIYVPRGNLHIMAAPGINHEVLSDYLPGVGHMSNF
ncbi:MAG: hypothetical protein COA71_01120 [SAR86 cluster bacterium]|uniref:Uncharacterized protein n=1 Tax=SAR86 cluster bacterium TaxID=2030880 RepID=A0A2A5CHZ3_9GAMM|nr:hypothetical protein [Gammaproteobacteria bacterium AH-315-E17]PCJ43504.1 MAG: hypothetical protein COA71_01120 [SAR86 cluster bacterium]